MEKKKRFTTGEIIKRENVTNDLWKIWLKTEDEFNFDPGQYCTVGYEGIERPYSIASSPDEELLELFIELVPEPDGILTPLLHNLYEGEKVSIRKRAKGLFKFQENFKNHIMLTTVTGVAPIVSMMRSMNFDPQKYNIWIYEGASFISEFGYSDELENISQRHPNINFTPTCSRPNDPENITWNGSTGRVNEIFSDVLNKIESANKDNTIIYACGHPEMVTEISDNYSEKYSFIEEKFWTP
tara:strand:+ start:433 stop:1155 length:723 start_codon:yes stop_codon:yes gene_type:complete